MSENMRKNKISYHTTNKIWKNVKLYKILENKNDLNLAIDDLINLGWETYQKQKNNDFEVKNE